MDDELIFHPPRRFGLVSMAATMVLFAVAGLSGLWEAAHASIGPQFLSYLLPALTAVGLVPLLAYRILALQRSYYRLDRDGISLHWGLRIEEIPMDAVIWVRAAEELGFRLPLPWLRWPGAVLGVRRLADGKPAEFLAVRASGLVAILTRDRMFIISPEEPGSFISAFRHLTELGSIAPWLPRSVYPSFLLARVWRDRLARSLLIAGLALSVVLLVWVSLLIPGRVTIHFGFKADGSPGDLVPAVQLLLLPVINGFFYLTDLFLGLFFYRRDESRAAASRQVLAYLLWGTGVLTALCFLSAVAFIIRAG